MSKLFIDILHMNLRSKFGIGIALGTVIGGITAYFLSPRTGQENRKIARKKYEELRGFMKEKNVEEMARSIFGKATKESKALYEKARAELNKALGDLKSEAADMNFEKYKELVDQVVTHLKDEKDATKDQLAKLSKYLLGRWDALSEMVGDDARLAKDKVETRLTNKDKKA